MVLQKGKSEVHHPFCETFYCKSWICARYLMWVCSFTDAPPYDNRDTIGSYWCWREKIQTNGLKWITEGEKKLEGKNRFKSAFFVFMREE